MIKLLIRLKNLRTYICKHNYLRTKYLTRSVTPENDRRLWKCNKCGKCVWIGIDE